MRQKLLMFFYDDTLSTKDFSSASSICLRPKTITKSFGFSWNLFFQNIQRTRLDFKEYDELRSIWKHGNDSNQYQLCTFWRILFYVDLKIYEASPTREIPFPFVLGHYLIQFYAQNSLHLYGTKQQQQQKENIVTKFFKRFGYTKICKISSSYFILSDSQFMIKRQGKWVTKNIWLTEIV